MQIITIKVDGITYELNQPLFTDFISIVSINGISIPNGLDLDMKYLADIEKNKIYNIILKKCNNTNDLRKSKERMSKAEAILKGLMGKDFLVRSYTHNSSSYYDITTVFINLPNNEEASFYLDKEQNEDNFYSNKDGELMIELSQHTKDELLKQYRNELDEYRRDLIEEQQQRKSIIDFRKKMDKIFKEVINSD